MRSRAALVFVLLWSFQGTSAGTSPGTAGTSARATVSERYEFPRDYFNHPEYRTEWWYYTGNLQAADGRRFGFELTFFRQAMHLSKVISATWRPDEIYLAHLALSDLDGQHFYYTERLNRAGPGLAGASLREQRIWNGNWRVQFQSARQELTAVCDRFALQLRLAPRKPIVDERQAVHYLSFTRIEAAGEVKLNGRSYRVSGEAWMDHEFFNQEDYWRAGWDWFSIQLDNGEELMFYSWRTKPADSSGTYVNREGKVQYLDSTSFHLAPVAWWKSGRSGARYPIAWKISAPSLGLQLSERTALKDQELLGANGISPTYWEGAVTYAGQIHSQPVRGVGYLEMTGYAQKP